MAYSDFMASGWFGPALRHQSTTTSPALTGTSIKAVLWDSQATTGSGNSDPDLAAAYNSGFWTATNWAVTGAIKTLAATVSWSVTGGVAALKSGDTNLQWTSLDSSFAGIFLYNDADASDLGLGFINFGADTTVSGTLTFTPDSTYGWLSIIY